ncbi:LETM1-related biofilm-associated protein [Flavobacterium branchiophilum]|uniref:Letm1 RBD domain-containing protein n=1 Tax=Flavobacterium branchiophilum (strain FL-15) TaxID=1034807 RepID=G2Z1I5_FLABF|nr:LETM1-related biofilm-associated protein [Flavobacterium branchiophilum]CCB69753.1 Protein of unknown function [Flavobacterium branchiophilum FL-15]
MINPSAPGWVEKFFQEQNFENINTEISTFKFYENIRKTGLIFGHIVSFDTPKQMDSLHWKPDEKTKIALLNTLYQLYLRNSNIKNHTDFLKIISKYYLEIIPNSNNIITKLFSTQDHSLKLEQIIDSRVQTNQDLLSKNFSNILTNALLFIDVLGFERYIHNGFISNNYFQKTEEIITSIISLALKFKQHKSKNDELISKLFESSVRYTKFSKINVQNMEQLEVGYFDHILEKYYMIDLAGLSMWSDFQIENDEIYFLHKLAELMQIDDSFVENSIEETKIYFQQNKSEIPYFNDANPVKHFYDNTALTIEVLIIRNKNRLLKELSQSKELLKLLAISTQRDLDEKEKKKIKLQLLDLCKTIPSLTIFLIPGGSLILPLLIKFIPKLLPSAFNENLTEED